MGNNFNGIIELRHVGAAALEVLDRFQALISHLVIIAVSRAQSSLVWQDIAGMVAAMTEGDPGVESERASRNIPG
jgi:hypothetical protein